MRKKDKKVLWYVGIGVIILALILIGGERGWFKIFAVTPQPEQVTPSPQTLLTSCSQVCSGQGFSQGYSLISNCNEGESKVVYGYVGQNPLLTCCCYNQAPQETCVDSDGDNRDTVGHVTYAGESYYDKCLAVGQGVTEYICENNQVKSKNWACDYGEICMQTRSGGHCIPAPHVWHQGDTVFQGSGSGSLIGVSNQISSLNLADYGITTDGTCQLGAQISTSWSYANPSLCSGLMGTEGLKWDFFDSNGLEYSRLDAVPLGLGIDLSPANGHNLEWDGVHNWVGTVTKIPNILPNCIINYEYQMRLYIYSCA